MRIDSAAFFASLIKTNPVVSVLRDINPPSAIGSTKDLSQIIAGEINEYTSLAHFSFFDHGIVQRAKVVIEEAEAVERVIQLDTQIVL